MNQVSEAKKGNITREMKLVAKSEGVGEEFIRQSVAEGKIVIPVNSHRGNKELKVCGIGEGLRTKVNANIGTSQDEAVVEDEIRKTVAAEEAGADTIMDLSTSANLVEVRKAVMKSTNLPLYGDSERL